MTTRAATLVLAVTFLAAPAARAEAAFGRTASLLLPSLEVGDASSPAGGGPPAAAAEKASEGAGAEAASLEAVDAAIKARRDRLTFHQVAGFGTEVLHLGALVFTIMDDHDRFGGGTQTGRWKTAEISLVGAAVVGTGLTFTFAALAPAPFERSGGLDSNVIHRVLMFAGAGLNLAKLALSFLLYSATGVQGNETLVTLHRVTTYAAPACYLAGAAIQVF